MLTNLNQIRRHKNVIEDVEKASLRMVFHALADFLEHAKATFITATSRPDVTAEELLRAALDAVGMPYVYLNLPGDVDYKKARWVFHPEFAIKQALMVDAKAEKSETNFSIQLGQTSMRVRFMVTGRTCRKIREVGTLPKVYQGQGMSHGFLTTTIVARFNYMESDCGCTRALTGITLAAVPNGILQGKYNRNYVHTIWQKGRDAESRGEKTRVRVSREKLIEKARWRVQDIPANGLIEWVD